MVYDLDMLLHDLPPQQDPKGGAKTPPRVSVSDFEQYNRNESSIWRTLTVALITAIVAISGTVFTLGIGNVKRHDLDELERKIYSTVEADFSVRDLVKHSELDEIMATRAPYLHDKQRIEDRFNYLTAQDKELANRITKIEEAGRDDFDKRIRDLEQRHK